MMLRKKKLGLALGAGSTKGFAHIGVLQVLEENGITIDCVSGSSIGAIVGGIYSVGTDLHLLEKFVESVNVWEYLDLALPRPAGGLLKGERMQELIRLLTHNKTFAGTKIPFTCVAVDLAEGKLTEFHEGALADAIRASMSIPAIFSPVQLNGHTYVDGGVIERVPCRAAKSLGADVVIGVDVGYKGGAVDVSGMNLYQQYNRCADIMQWEITKLRMGAADIMLTPDLSFVKGHFGTGEAQRCVEEGRRAATEALPDIQRLLKRSLLPASFKR